MSDYFAAANSAHGFVSWFDDIFAPETLGRTYILKGGSGTGKSTLMKRAAARCEEAGGEVERFRCSSDAASLDGVILRLGGDSAAILDGTAPHLRDPRYPGAAEEIVHLGAFWDAGALRAHRAEIVALTKRKAALYADAYRSLAAAGLAAREVLAAAGGCLLSEKLDAAAHRLLCQRMKSHRVKPSGAPVRRIRALSAIATQGEVHFDGAREGYEICLAVDAAGSAPYLFDALLRAADALGLDYDRAPMPLLPERTEALTFPKLSLCVLSRTDAADVRPINMTRFLDRAALPDRAHLRSLRRLEREFTDAALAKLADVRRQHAALEEIYIAAMDFEAMGKMTDALLARMFG